MKKEEFKLNTIENLSAALTGSLINHFSIIETLINHIIRKITFDDEKEYDRYMEILNKEQMTMNIKKKLFKLCIEKYEMKYNKDLPITKKSLDNIIDKRNVLAHWMVDVSSEGRKTYEQSGRKEIRYLKHYHKRNENEYECFTLEKITNLSKSINAIHAEILNMVKDIDPLFKTSPK